MSPSSAAKQRRPGRFAEGAALSGARIKRATTKNGCSSGESRDRVPKVQGWAVNAAHAESLR